MSEKRIGRPTILTPEVTAEVCKRLELAVPDKHAAEECGVSEALFYRWLRLGEAGQEPYVAFFEAVTRAKAKCITNLHVKALAGGKGSSAAMWMLERRFWREYAQHMRIDTPPPDPLASISEQELDLEISAQRKRVADYERVRAMLGAAPPKDEDGPE